MTDYKNIRGKKIKFFTSDLDNTQGEGQIFYSNTDSEYKVAVDGIMEQVHKLLLFVQEVKMEVQEQLL